MNLTGRTTSPKPAKAVKDPARPDVGVLRRLIRHDPIAGKLYWRRRSPSEFPIPKGNYSQEGVAASWNSRFEGNPALAHLSVRGYLNGSIKPHTLTAHRVMWAIHYGKWPTHQIDHINGNRTDNRIANLRDVTNAENSRNSGMKTSNKSGVSGVYFQKETGNWIAQITSKRKKFHLGSFSLLDDAAKARKAAEKNTGSTPIMGGRHEPCRDRVDRKVGRHGNPCPC